MVGWLVCVTSVGVLVILFILFCGVFQCVLKYTVWSVWVYGRLTRVCYKCVCVGYLVCYNVVSVVVWLVGSDVLQVCLCVCAAQRMAMSQPDIMFVFYIMWSVWVCCQHCWYGWLAPMC